jgi:hypothetical protein
VNPRGQIGFVSTIMAACGILSIIAAARLGGEGGPVLRWLAILDFVLLTLISLGVYAGRATIFNVVLLILISLYVSGRRFSPFRPRTLVVTTLLLLSTWYFSTTFLSAREGNTSALLVLDATQRAQVRPWIKQRADSDPNVGLALVSIGYFGSPLPTLAFYMQQPMPGPFYGEYSYPLVSRAIGTLTGEWSREQWVDHRRQVFAPLESRNYFGNVWTTLLRDLLVDFGLLGTVIFCGLSGAFVAWARNQYEAFGALHYHYLEVLASFTLTFGAMASVLWSSFVAVPFFLALVIMCLVRLEFAPAVARATLPRR